MKLEFFILGILNFRPFTGYEMKKYMDTEGRFGRRRAHLSQLYRTLKRMTEAGWIEFEVQEREYQPDLKCYHITPLGKETFMAWLKAADEPEFRFHELGFINRFGFSSMLEKEVLLAQLNAELAYRREQIAEFRNRDRTIEDLEPTGIVNEDNIELIAEIIHEYGTGSMDHYVGWLDNAIHRIQTEM
ncbi:MAG: PadR family transcriptional regulator [Candidatus Promineifilaceae bacterium]